MLDLPSPPMRAGGRTGRRWPRSSIIPSRGIPTAPWHRRNRSSTWSRGDLLRAPRHPSKEEEDRQTDRERERRVRFVRPRLTPGPRVALRAYQGGPARQCGKSLYLIIDRVSHSSLLPCILGSGHGVSLSALSLARLTMQRGTVRVGTPPPPPSGSAGRCRGGHAPPR